MPAPVLSATRINISLALYLVYVWLSHSISILQYIRFAQCACVCVFDSPDIRDRVSLCVCTFVYPILTAREKEKQTMAIASSHHLTVRFSFNGRKIQLSLSQTQRINVSFCLNFGQFRVKLQPLFLDLRILNGYNILFFKFESFPVFTTSRKFSISLWFNFLFF